MTVLVVALGAAVGAPTRYLVDLFVQSRHSSSLPWGTITVNAIGSFVIGFIAGLAATSDLDQAVVALISTGFCGALTTFSTFSFETVRLIEQQHLTAAVLNLGLSLVLTIVLCLGGYELAAAYLITSPMKGRVSMNDNPPEIPSRRLQLRDGDTTTGGLVVGFDRHEASTAALKSAATLATRLSIVVHVVHAVDLRDYPIDPDGPDWEEEARATLRDEERTVQDVLDPFGCAWTYQAGRHDPADLLAAVAVETKAMMIVVGSHGQGMGNALSHLFEGSIEHRLLSERPPCGVLVVPSPSTRP